MLAIKLDTRYRFNFIRNQWCCKKNKIDSDLKGTYYHGHFLFSLFLLLLNLIILPPPLHFFLYSSLHLHYDPIGPFIDPSSTLRRPYTPFFFQHSFVNSETIYHPHTSIVFPPPQPHFYCFNSTNTPNTFLLFSCFPSPPPPPHFYNFAYFYPSIFKRNVVTLGHQSTEEGGETFSDTTHGCSFSVMFIICFMVKNGSSVLMVHGVLYYLNALVSLQL